jgi:glycogen operon protein
MISGGDEIGRTQSGNNNAYCQDNPISWYDWTPTAEKESLLEFTARLIKLRRHHPNLRRRKFFQDQQIRNSRDISWYGTDGKELDQAAWEAGWGRALGMMLNGETLDVVDELGNPIVDKSFLLLFNAHYEPVEFTLPASPHGRRWKCLLNTFDLEKPFCSFLVRKRLKLEGRSLVLLTEQKPRTISLRSTSAA